MKVFVILMMVYLFIDVVLKAYRLHRQDFTIESWTLVPDVAVNGVLALWAALLIGGRQT